MCVHSNIAFSLSQSMLISDSDYSTTPLNRSMLLFKRYLELLLRAEQRKSLLLHPSLSRSAALREGERPLLRSRRASASIGLTKTRRNFSRCAVSRIIFFIEATLSIRLIYSIGSKSLLTSKVAPLLTLRTRCATSQRSILTSLIFLKEKRSCLS